MGTSLNVVESVAKFDFQFRRLEEHPVLAIKLDI